jgi:hypothetical protein
MCAWKKVGAQIFARHFSTPCRIAQTIRHKEANSKIKVTILVLFVPCVWTKNGLLLLVIEWWVSKLNTVPAGSDFVFEIPSGPFRTSL